MKRVVAIIGLGLLIVVVAGCGSVRRSSHSVLDASGRSILYRGVSLVGATGANGAPKRVTDAEAVRAGRTARPFWLSNLASGELGPRSNLSPRQFRSKLARTASRYGFSVKRLQFVRTRGQVAPLVIVETDSYLAFARASTSKRRTSEACRFSSWTTSRVAAVNGREPTSSSRSSAADRMVGCARARECHLRIVGVSTRALRAYSQLMRVRLAAGVAVIAAATTGAFVLSSALADQPPQPPFLFGTTRAQPVAGERFTGLTVGYISDRLDRLACHGSIGSTQLVGRVERFYTYGMAGPSTASCSWLIPRAAAGKTLRAWDRAYYLGDGSYWSCSCNANWNIKP